MRYKYDYKPMSQDTKDMLNALVWAAAFLVVAVMFMLPFWVPVNWIVF